MKSYLIFWPILAQMLIPIVVLLLNGKRKAGDVKAGTVDRQKAAMDNEAWSKPVILTSKNLANQFQFPTIFYVLCLILGSINAVTTFTLAIAWLFVFTRYVHAYAHVQNNIMKVRMPTFIVGVFFLLILFGTTVVSLFNYTN